jgi:AcrR family transcriptional regulator
MSKENLKTKSRIIKESTTLFGKKSYAEVTIKDICQKAQCNIAAINYHFGNKEELYCEIFEQAYQKTIQTIAKKTVNLPPRCELEALIDLRLESILFPTEKHSFSQLINQEIQTPSPIHQFITSKYLTLMFDRLKETIKACLGPSATPLQVQLSAFSVRSLCIGLNITIKQDQGFWHSQTPLTLKQEMKSFIINSVFDYKKQIGG